MSAVSDEVMPSGTRYDLDRHVYGLVADAFARLVKCGALPVAGLPAPCVERHGDATRISGCAGEYLLRAHGVTGAVGVFDIGPGATPHVGDWIATFPAAIDAVMYAAQIAAAPRPGRR